MYTRLRLLLPVKGSLKNNTGRVVTYWKVTARFLDAAGNEVDSDYTNNGENLHPGAQKRFEIMHGHTSGSKTATVEVSEVVYADGAP